MSTTKSFPKNTLKAITELIVRTCDPQQVILFGSYAKENHHAVSDLDILVIGNFQNSRYLRDVELKGMLRSFSIPIDLHMLSATELENDSRAPYSFLNNVHKSWVILYMREENQV